MRLPAILNTTAARLSALFLLLFMVCAIALVTYMTALSVRMLTGQTREAIDQEIAQLNQVYQIAGLPGLVRAVDRRARQPGANLFLIADPAGRILAGMFGFSGLGLEGVTAEGFAIRALERAVEIDPEYTEARERLEKAKAAREAAA